MGDPVGYVEVGVPPPLPVPAGGHNLRVPRPKPTTLASSGELAITRYGVCVRVSAVYTTTTVMAFKAWILVKAVHILLALLVLTSQCIQNCVAAEKQCDATHSCPADTTCCCVMPIGVDICVSWGCCPLPDATCCPDHRHCCPANMPICDEVTKQCASKDDGTTHVRRAPWSDVTPAKITDS